MGPECRFVLDSGDQALKSVARRDVDKEYLVKDTAILEWGYDKFKEIVQYKTFRRGFEEGPFLLVVSIAVRQAPFQWNHDSNVVLLAKRERESEFHVQGFC